MSEESSLNLPNEKHSDCIVGYRVWKLATVEEKPYLVSATKDIKWPYRKAIERDMLENAGIHAVRSGVNLLELYANYCASVIGEIYMWGRVEEFEQGYLSDFAYPKRLAVHENTDPMIVLGLEEGYGIAVDMRDIPKPTTPQDVRQHAQAYLGQGNSQAMQMMQAQQNTFGLLMGGLSGLSGLSGIFGKP